MSDIQILNILCQSVTCFFIFKHSSFEFFVRKCVDVRFLRAGCCSFGFSLLWGRISRIPHDPCSLALVSAHLKIQPPLPGFTNCLQQEKPFTHQPSQRLGRTVSEDHSQWNEAALGVPKWAWCQGWTTVKEVNTTFLLSLSVSQESWL